MFADLGGQMIAGCLGGVVAAAVVLVLYYRTFRPRLAAGDVLRMERIRLRMGLLARVVQGGIVEEIVFRWGAMTVLVSAGSALTGTASVGVNWFAILGAALLFGWAHVPGAVTLGIERDRTLIYAALVLNGWLGVICGWLYWQHGLFSAMVAHAVVHVLWYPFDKRLYRQLELASRAS